MNKRIFIFLFIIGALCLYGCADDFATRINLDENTSEVQVVSWYDNENSYTSQMVRTIKHFGKLLNA